MTGQPRFFSLEFHLHFLPGVIRARWHGVGPPRTGFMPSGTLEIMVLFALCAILLAVGVPGLVGSDPGRGSMLLAGLGGAGALALLGLSIYSTRGSPLSYDRFDVGLFFFLVALGGTAGLWYAVLTDPDRFAGAQWRQSHGLARSLWTAGGALGGYLVGVPAALWLQRLGPLGGFISAFALPAIIGLIVTNAVLLSL